MTPGTTRVYRYDLPLAHPIRVGGERLTRRRGWLLERADADGRSAWGEAAPLPGFSRETFDEAGEALIALCGVSDPPPDAPPSVRFALHAARGDTTPSGNRRVPLCALLRGDGLQKLTHASEAARKGYQAVKLKVGGRKVGEDIALTLNLRSLLGPDVALRLDANRAWSLEEAESFLRRMTEEDALYALAPVAFIEEPLKDWTQLPELAARTRVPLALDETLQEVFGARTVSRAEAEPAFRAASCWVWKPTLCGPFQTATEDWLSFGPPFRGGIRGSEPGDVPDSGALAGTGLLRFARNDLEKTRHCERSEAISCSRKRGIPPHGEIKTGLPVVSSAAYESGVGIAAIVRAAGEGVLEPLGIDTYAALAEDVLARRLPLDAPEAEVGGVLAAAGDVVRSRLELVHEHP
ncbi:MAG: o-succinylbenzoate synthase [Candidatus Hydrogenedentes bacterium]|nr:o-succinylbenzoate synthase [Candidatus Hydrogenedentota bacterium]